MQLANILLDVGGDGTTVVHKSKVTPAEVAVLRVLHGDDAISDVEVLDDQAMDIDNPNKARTHRAEIARLMDVYGKPLPEGGRAAEAVSRLFPGAAARVFENFDELELDDTQFKADTRKTAAPGKTKVADDEASDLSKKSVADLKTLADDENIDLDGATKKADIVAKIEAARDANREPANDAADNEDGIGDMPGGSVFE